MNKKTISILLAIFIFAGFVYNANPIIAVEEWQTESSTKCEVATAHETAGKFEKSIGKRYIPVETNFKDIVDIKIIVDNVGIYGTKYRVKAIQEWDSKIFYSDSFILNAIGEENVNYTFTMPNKNAGMTFKVEQCNDNIDNDGDPAGTWEPSTHTDAIYTFTIPLAGSGGGSGEAGRGYSGLELDYPEVSGALEPDSATNLAEFIKYIFNLSIGIGGLLAFAVFIYGGIRYLTSAGNASAIGDARSWMFGGITGLFLLLTSYLILTAINPNLVIFKEMIPLQSDTGICLFSDDAIDKELPCTGTGKKYYTISDIPRIDITKFVPTSIKFISPQDELTSIFLFANSNFEATTTDEIIKIDNNNDGETSILDSFFGTNVPNIDIHDFIPIDKDFISLSFLENKHGIYLYKEVDYCLEDINDEKSKYLCKTPPKYVSSSIGDLGDWKQKAKSLKYNTAGGKNIGAILFTQNNFTGKCAIAFNADNKNIGIKNLKIREKQSYFPSIGEYGLSSLKMFSIEYGAISEGTVTFCNAKNCSSDGKKIFTPSYTCREGETHLECKERDPNVENPGNPIMIFKYLESGTEESGKCYIDGNRSSDFCTFEGMDSSSEEKDKQLHRNILAYKIDGDFEVIVHTKPNLGQDVTNETEKQEILCRWIEPNDEGLVVSIISEGGGVFAEGKDGRKIESIIIIPTE